MLISLLIAALGIKAGMGVLFWVIWVFVFMLQAAATLAGLDTSSHGGDV